MSDEPNRISASFDAPLTVIENVTITAGDEVFDVPVATIKIVNGELSLDGLKPEDKLRFASAVRKLGYN